MQGTLEGERGKKPSMGKIFLRRKKRKKRGENHNPVTGQVPHHPNYRRIFGGRGGQKGVKVFKGRARKGLGKKGG